MSPFALLLLAGTSAFVFPKIFGGRREQRRRKRAIAKNPLCGAYWSYGQAIVPFEAKDGWAYSLYDAAGRLDELVAAERGLARFTTKELAVEDGIAAAAAAVDAQVAAGGPPGVLDPSAWGAPPRPHIRVFTPPGMAAQLPPEVDDVFCKDPGTNQVWVDDSCSVIVEGAGFEPYSQGVKTLGEANAPSVQEALAIQGNSVYGFVAHLMADFDQADELAYLVADDLGCGTNGGPLDPFQDLYVADLARRISTWVVEAGGIPFDP